MVKLHCINRSNNFLLGNICRTKMHVRIHHDVLEQFQPQNGVGESCHTIDDKKPQSVLTDAKFNGSFFPEDGDGAGRSRSLDLVVHGFGTKINVLSIAPAFAP